MKITKVYNEDWCAIYVDGELIQEGHSVNFYEFIQFLIEKGVVTEYGNFEAITDSNFPDSLDDVNFIEDEG